MTALFDSHVHLDAAEFDVDRGEVLRAARAAGVTGMLIPAIVASAWRSLRDWLSSNTASAVGECGLDFHDVSLDLERQLHFLREQLQLAREFGLPLVLHARGAFEQVILELQRFIREHGALCGVVHSFSGSVEQAKRLWEMGFLIGIGGPLTYPRARRLRGLVATMPLEYLLLETDAPDQPTPAIAASATNRHGSSMCSIAWRGCAGGHVRTSRAPPLPMRRLFGIGVPSGPRQEPA